jgi:hypothetical protein
MSRSRGCSVSLNESRFVLDNDAERGSQTIPALEGLVTAGLLSAGDVSDLRVLEGQGDEAAAQLIANGHSARDFGKAALKALLCVSDAGMQRYVLQLVEDALLPDLCGNASKIFGGGELQQGKEEDLLSGGDVAMQPEDGAGRLRLDVSLI